MPSRRRRLSQVTHGRVAMLSVIGFLVAESFHPLFGGEIIGPAIDHLTEVRKIQPEFFELLAVTIGVVETSRAQNGWVPPAEVEGKQFLNDDYYPGDINFGTSARGSLRTPLRWHDAPHHNHHRHHHHTSTSSLPSRIPDPLGLKPEDPAEFAEMQTKELQHGRLAMLASMGFIAQELTDHLGIVEHFQ